MKFILFLLLLAILFVVGSPQGKFKVQEGGDSIKFWYAADDKSIILKPHDGDWWTKVGKDNDYRIRNDRTGMVVAYVGNDQQLKLVEPSTSQLQLWQFSAPNPEGEVSIRASNYKSIYAYPGPLGNSVFARKAAKYTPYADPIWKLQTAAAKTPPTP